MALIQCKECGNNISDKATTCPQCGAPISKKSCTTGCLRFLFLAICAFVGLFFLAAFGTAIFSPKRHSSTTPSPARDSTSATITSKQPESPTPSISPAPTPIPTEPKSITSTAPPQATAETKAPKKEASLVDLAKKGGELFKKLKAEYPDPPDDGKYGLPPRIVEMSIYGEMTNYPVMQLNVPDEAWLKLAEEDKTALVEYTKSQVIEARTNPDKYQMTPPSAPAYQTIRRNVQGIKDDAWKICVGHIDKNDGLIVDATVLWGASANAAKRVQPAVSVINSGWDGSVWQVKKWMKNNLKDPDSLQFIEWSPVATDNSGDYWVRCKYRAKNSFGGYVVENKAFHLDQHGDVVGVNDVP